MSIRTAAHPYRFAGLASVILFAASSLALGACGEGSGEQCSSDDDCGEGQSCSFGSCTDDGGGFGPVGNSNGNGNTNANSNGNGNAVVDVEGPVIVIREPDPYEAESGVITILVDVFDGGSGVDPTSVAAIVADRETVPLSPTQADGNRYRAPLDTQPLSNQLAPSLEIVARDRAGNETVVGTSFVLDYAGPAVDLEPRDIRPYERDDVNTVLTGAIGGVRCGARFRVLGDSAVRDGEIISPSSRFGLAFYPRASVRDLAVEDDYGVVSRVAGVDPESVVFAFLDQEAIAAGRRLLTSNRSDGRCNTLSPEVIPSPGEDPTIEQKAILQAAIQVDALGFPDFSLTRLEKVEPGISATVPPDPCDGWGSDQDAETVDEGLCPTVDISLMVFTGANNNDADRTSRVFVANDYDPASRSLCAGGFFDSVNFVADGPACLTVYARDRLGNESTGRPLYICIDKDGTGVCDGFNPTLTEMINACTDGCVPRDWDGEPTDPPVLRPF